MMHMQYVQTLHTIYIHDFIHTLIIYVPLSDRIWSSSENQFKHELKRQLNDVARL